MELEFEVDALAEEVIVSRSIKTVEAGGAAGDVLLELIGFFENAELGDFLAEVTLVEWLLEDEFVEVLELGEGEFFGKELEADGLVADFSAEAFFGELEDVGVIEGERGKIIEGEPGGISGVGRGGGWVLDEVDECEVGDGDDMLAGVAIWGADGGELFEEDVFQSSLFLKFAASAGIDVFTDVNEASGEGPLVFKGLDGSLDEEDFEVVFIEPEDDAIGSEGWSGVVIGEAHD